MLEADAAVMRAPEPPIFFELKHLYTTRYVARRIVDGLLHLARVTSAVVNSSGVLVIIVNNANTDTDIEEWRALATRLAAEYQSIIGVYIGRYSEFIDLPAQEFADKLGLDDTSPSGYRLR